MSERVRAFVAVLLSEEVRAALAQEVGRLRSVAPAVGWIRAENLHMTLKFLGHIPPETLARVEAGLAEAVADQPTLTLAFAGLGAFPSAERPRVIWAGVVEGAEALVALQARVEDA
ncbi:MAG: RNA 2',3'-cyclic phosphodiesterase, partial [Candidatus Rokubacteria bacterium]|nr:RNA 2',3'-cyclic phosphodiesterase [Candidatus Rokubacteria bacterium]